MHASNSLENKSLPRKNVLLIENGTICTPLKVIEDGAVLVRNGKIAYVGSKTQKVPKSLMRINAEGHVVCPGFVDLQVNGGGGIFLTEDGTYEGVCTMAKTHARFGTTSMLPTIITAEAEKISNALITVSQAIEKGTNGATVLGSHLEGPFINEKKKGAHDARSIRSPSISDFDRFYQASNGTMKILTLAPEIEGSLNLISHAKKRGVFVSIGHSTATYSQLSISVDAGLSLATHIFNAMGGSGQQRAWNSWCNTIK